MHATHAARTVPLGKSAAPLEPTKSVFEFVPAPLTQHDSRVSNRPVAGAPMKLIASMRLGHDGGYELQKAFSSGRIWLRLTRDPQRNNLAFWSEKKSALTEWTAIAAELARRLREVAVDDRPAIDTAC